MLLLMSKKKLFFAGFALLTLYGAYASHVPRYLEQNDLKAINMLDVSDHCDGTSKTINVEVQANCARKIQERIHLLVANTKCRGRFIRTEPMDFINAGNGCCYDKSRFIEKAFQHYGYEIRHIHLNDTSKFGIFSTLIPNTPSHSTSEVKTVKGWMGVDSNEEFILLDSDQEPKTYREALESGFISTVTTNKFYSLPLKVIYGLYSRHGTFFPPYFPFFEFHTQDLVHNLSD